MKITGFPSTSRFPFGFTWMAGLLLFLTDPVNAYLTKTECYDLFQLHLERALPYPPDTSGYTPFRSYVDSCGTEQKYHLFDSLKAVLIDSLSGKVKAEYLFVDVIDPLFRLFWQSYYYNDDAFFRYALLQCEGSNVIIDSVQKLTYTPTQHLTVLTIKNQWWLLGEHPDTVICLKNHTNFVDSVATLVIDNDGLPLYYRRAFMELDHYADPVELNTGPCTLSIDSTFRGRELYHLSVFDSSFIALSGDTGLVAISTDGGGHWRKAARFTINSITQIGFLSKRSGYCIENNMTLWRTDDSGRTWTKTDLRQGMYQHLAVFDSTRIVLFDPLNGNLISSDGGETWTQTAVFFNRIMAVTSRNRAWGINRTEVSTTLDAGSNWSVISRLDSTVYPQAMTFIDERIGLISCASGMVALSTDSAKHWQYLQLPAIEDIFGIFHTADNAIIAVSRLFTVFSSTDTGTTWKKEKVYYPATVKNVYSISNRRSVWMTTSGLLFFCEAHSVMVAVPHGSTQKPPLSPVRPDLRSATGFTLDGRVVPTGNRVTGFCLVKDSRGSRKRLSVK